MYMNSIIVIIIFFEKYQNKNKNRTFFSFRISEASPLRHANNKTLVLIFFSRFLEFLRKKYPQTNEL